MEESSTLVFFVNGKKIEDPNVDPEWTLLYYLRNKLRLCGTKLGCSEGGCGACTVMISKYDRKKDHILHLAVNACLAPVCSMHGLAVTTVEGIGSTKTRLHPIQQRIAKAHGSQCGFCTPGIVMSMYALLRSTNRPNLEDLETAFQGNLCRCTGYRPIMESFKTFTENWEELRNGFANGNCVTNGGGIGTNGVCAMGDQCCRMKNGEDAPDVLFERSEFSPVDASQEPIFPPELKTSGKLDGENLRIKGKRVEWYRPSTLDKVLELKQKFPHSKVVVGNTEIGVEVKFKHVVYPVLLHTTRIEEMIQITSDNLGITIGASVTLNELQIYLHEKLKTLSKYQTSSLKAIYEMLQLFAGKQVRNVAAVGGNIMTSSPISDLNPIFMAANVVLTLASKSRGLREVYMDENFFTGYRKNVVKEDEVLLSIKVPYTSRNQYFFAYKQSRRRHDDTAIVTSAFNITLSPYTHAIEKVRMALGGMAPTTVMPLKTMRNSIGLAWNKETLEKICSFLIEDLPLDDNAPGGMVQYRSSLTLSHFFKVFSAICQKLHVVLPDVNANPRDLSAVNELHKKSYKSAQYFQIVPRTDEKINSIGKPVVHSSAYKQATGEALYCDDIPFFENELYMAFVYSTRSHAEIVSIEPSRALKMDGVHAFFSAKDLPAEKNVCGPIFKDDEVFVSKTVKCRGQIIGAIVAQDQETAKLAARSVVVEYADLEPVIISIEDAIKHKSFFNEEPVVITKGDVDGIFAEAPHTIEGECRTGGQQHFYLETQCSIAVPKEGDEMDIYCSTQHAANLTGCASHLLGVPQNRIATKVKRVGGAFGGKEWKSMAVALPAVLAAKRLNRPVRIMLDRDEDMVLCGGRHPFYFKYKTAFDGTGKILAHDIVMYSNAGCTTDLSLEVLERAIYHCENSYNIPNIRIKGYVCKTNLASNTAFRGFGAPQSMFSTETMIRDIAEYLNEDPVKVSKLNLYKEGDTTFYKQKLDYCPLQRCWKEVLDLSNYSERRQNVEEFNRENRWKKRGLAVVPTKYGVGFTKPFLSQAGVLVNIYLDGSVLLHYGGIEMGQGLHTKMIQVASNVLQIPTSEIYINETATDKVPNTSPTVASLGSDLNGMAVMRACELLNERLEPFKVKNPKGKWVDWVIAAYLDRVSLSATGFYATPEFKFDWEKNEGDLYSYFTCGVACTEVEVDCLTGDHQVVRTDIVMDLGESLNPAIDIGQIEGAFAQGYGLYLLEEVVYLKDGTLFTKGPGVYKLPGLSDIPGEFNVSLLKGAPNPRAVYSSKAVGEPPLFLASSALFAIREAIKSARKDAGHEGKFTLNAPATSARIRMACQDQFTSKFTKPEGYFLEEWNVIP